MGLEQGRDPLTVKTSDYQDIKLENFVGVYQAIKDNMGCSDAILESIEKMNGDIRNKEFFKEARLEFIKNNPKGTMREYLGSLGFNVEDASGLTFQEIGLDMKRGNPLVILKTVNNESGIDWHTIVLTRYKVKTYTGDPKVWFWDPYWGSVRNRWKWTLQNPNFFSESFILKLK